VQVVPEDAQIQSKGKTITRKGTEDNPAVKVRRRNLIACAEWRQ
jgi:hypothetical protein